MGRRTWLVPRNDLTPDHPEPGCIASFIITALVLILIYVAVFIAVFVTSSAIDSYSRRMDRIENALHLKPCKVMRPLAWWPFLWDTDCPK